MVLPSKPISELSEKQSRDSHLVFDFTEFDQTITKKRALKKTKTRQFKQWPSHKREKNMFDGGGKLANFLFLSFCRFLYVSGGKKVEPTHHSSDLPDTLFWSRLHKINCKKGGSEVKVQKGESCITLGAGSAKNIPCILF